MDLFFGRPAQRALRNSLEIMPGDASIPEVKDGLATFPSVRAVGGLNLSHKAVCSLQQNGANRSSEKPLPFLSAVHICRYMCFSHAYRRTLYCFECSFRSFD